MNNIRYVTPSLAIAILFLVLSIPVWGKQENSVTHNIVDSTPKMVVFNPGVRWNPGEPGDFWKQQLGFSSAGELMPTSTTVTRQKSTIYRFEQSYKGARVEFSSCAVVVVDGIARFANCNLYRIPDDKAIRISITETDALSKALRYVGAEQYMWQSQSMEELFRHEMNRTDTTYFPRARYVWIENLNGKEQDRKLHFAYAFNIYALKPLSRQMVYVDANSGEILFANNLLHHTGATGASLYSGNVNFQAGFIGGSYSLHDSTRGNGINTYSCANGPGAPTYEVTSSSTTFASDASLDAHWGAEKVFDYWLNEQGRNSFDDAGAAINSYTHLQVGYNNAYWDGSKMVYGDGSGIAASGFSPLTSLDVCAHEIGHAVCSHTSNLIYARESGAMNEGFSDIWAAVIESYADPHETDAVAKSKWKIGEEISASSLRRMDNPNLKAQPDTYGGTDWFNLTGCMPNGVNDQCGVHTNSGVLNYWFYLLCTGGSGTNDIGNSFAVSGIGMTEGAAIAYQTELVLASNATFTDCRAATITVATTLYGSCSPEVEAVTQAWYAVGVGSGFSLSTGPITGAAAVCAGASTTLSNSGIGGTWTSSNPAVAAIGSTTGIVSGISAGTTVITYAVGTGCTSVAIVTVNTTPGAISGSLAVCASASSSLSATPSGGTWSSSNAAVATIGSGSGVITGTASGTAAISYTLATGCQTTGTVTVNAIGSIGGPGVVCPGGTITLTNSTPGGTWSSTVTAHATATATTGVITGASAGTTTISYTLTGSCGTVAATMIITTNPLPSAGTISGPSSVCSGYSLTLTPTVTGGTWTSSDTNKAIVSAGIVTGLLAGTATISYAVSNSCGAASATKVMTVNAPLVGDMVVTIAGSADTNYSGDGGLATAAGIYGPQGMSFDNAGNLLICETAHSVVRKVNNAGIISTIAGTGVYGFSGDGGLSTMAMLHLSWGSTNNVTVDKQNNIYIADLANGRIRKINPMGIITTFAGTGDGTGPDLDGMPATATNIGAPYGIAVNKHGNVIFSDNWGRIRKIDSSGIITTIGGIKGGGFSGDGGPATLARMSSYGICLDTIGNIYIGDVNNNRIRKIDTFGIINTIAGNGVYGFGGDGGPALSASFRSPFDVCVDAAGNVYIADDWNYRIRKVSTSGIITTVAGAGGGFNGDSVVASAALLQNPAGVKMSSTGLVFSEAGGAEYVK